MSAEDSFYFEKEEPIKSCLLALRDIILSHDEHITAAWKYGMPFFCFQGKMFCYLWVNKKRRQPYLGLVEGKHLEHPDLLAEKRSRMKIMLIDSNEDLPVETIRAVLQEAIDFYRKKPQIKMQNVKFKTVDEFLDFLPPDELRIVEILRQLVLECMPEAEEKLAYNVPYYKMCRNICFIWPASVLWGKQKTYTGVRLGFTNGYLLQDEIDYLDKGDRKQVYWKDFKDTNQIDQELIKAYLYEAMILDQDLALK